MAKAKTAAAVADTTTTTDEATSETATENTTGSETSADAGTSSEGTDAGAADQVEKAEATEGAAASSGVDLVDTASASTAAESTAAVAVLSAEGLEANDKPKTAAEALELVKQFYPQAEFAQAVAELNGASAAAANSISATVINDDNFYRVLSPLEHNHKLYAVGSAVVLTDEEAAPLLGRAVEAI